VIFGLTGFEQLGDARANRPVMSAHFVVCAGFGESLTGDVLAFHAPMFAPTGRG